MLVLITNDDGIDSKGLLALRAAVSRTPGARVEVLAPNRDWSAVGHTKTMDRPLRVTEVELPDGSRGYASDGTPSDCVALAVLGFLGERPALVVSGINRGPNLGDDITYSGTVAAAMEAVVSGIPGIAVSYGDRYSWEYEAAATFAAGLVARAIERGLAPDILLNVNVPAGEIAGVEVTRLGKRAYYDELIERVDPYGRKYYWIGGEEPGGEVEPGTDLAAVAAGRISVTPIHLDLTNHRLLEQVRGWELERVLGGGDEGEGGEAGRRRGGEEWERGRSGVGERPSP
jgi:5'-nucleotidase